MSCKLYLILCQTLEVAKVFFHDYTWFHLNKSSFIPANEFFSSRCNDLFEHALLCQHSTAPEKKYCSLIPIEFFFWTFTRSTWLNHVILSYFTVHYVPNQVWFPAFLLSQSCFSCSGSFVQLAIYGFWLVVSEDLFYSDDYLQFTCELYSWGSLLG